MTAAARPTGAWRGGWAGLCLLAALAYETGCARIERPGIAGASPAAPAAGAIVEFVGEPGDCDGAPANASALLRRHLGNTDRLMEARDVPYYALPEFRISGALRSTRRWLQARPGKDAVVLMGRDPTRHCAYLIDADGIAAFGTSPASAAELSGLYRQWLARAEIDCVSSGRRQAVNLRSRGGVDCRSLRNRVTTRSRYAVLNELAQALFPGDVRRIALGYQHLYVIPYGDLGIIPYAALPSGVDGARFIDHTSVSIAPSADVFLGDEAMRFVRGNSRAHCSMGQASVVVGDPSARYSEAPYRYWRFPPLPGARDEADRVSRTLGTSPLIGEAATPERFLERAATARYIHIASHGVSDWREPLRGFLALSGHPLTAETVQSACIPSELVVLSACQTGLGGEHAGGVIGLARGFHLAGVDEVVMSLWSVDDLWTRELMTRFWVKVANRGEAETTSDLLRAAMIETRAEIQRRNPNVVPNEKLWAPFTVFGVPPRQSAAARPQALRPAEPPAGAAAGQTPHAAAPGSGAASRQVGQVFRDCAHCPEMTALTGGTFMMGGDAFPSEAPRHLVRIAAFAIGVHAVTRAQYAAFANGSGYAGGADCLNERYGPIAEDPNGTWDDPGFDQADDQPVVCMSWADAQAYVGWLNTQTSGGYRLLSEAEYEYAERAGAAGTYYWGEDPNQACVYANAADATWYTRFRHPLFEHLDCNDGELYTAAVGSYRPNAFGLYDMAGNASSWLQDCRQDDYRNAPADGSANVGGPCSERAVRGGAWNSNRQALRSASRDWLHPAVRRYNVGLRVARTLS